LFQGGRSEELGKPDNFGGPGIIGSDEPFDAMIERKRHSPKQRNRDISLSTLELCQITQRDLGQFGQNTTGNTSSFASLADAFPDKRDELIGAFLYLKPSFLQPAAL
jgi:hypothetical protein